MCNQELTLSGVGAHHQNGCSERAVKTVSMWARALMMHQLLHWPDHFDEANWGFAFTHAVFVWNNLPRERDGCTPTELFCKSASPNISNLLSNLRVWGCPAWVLDPQLQEGNYLPKFSARSHCGMYVGSSSQHADTIGRILNLQTGHVSPQFHVV